MTIAAPPRNTMPGARSSIVLQWIAGVAGGTLVVAAMIAGFTEPVLSRWFSWDGFPHAMEIVLGAAIVAGALHGAVVGGLQAAILRSNSLPVRGWTPATSIAAAFSWAACMILNLVAVDRDVSMNGWIGLVIVAGLAFGAAIGFAQWIVLRRHILHAGKWIAANAVAWLAASGVVLTGVRMADSAHAPAASFALLLATVLGAGLVSGLLTGLPLIQLLRGANRRH